MTYQREDSVEQYLVERIEALGGIAYKFTSPGRVGVPDRLCVLPNGVLLFVEVKAPQGRLAPSQRREIARLRDMGQCVLVVWSRESVDEELKAKGY